METFINRWLWLMSLKELNLVRDAIKEYNMKQQNGTNLANQSQATAANTSATSGQKTTTTSTTTTSPNEPPPPSPASSVGSNSNKHQQQQQSQSVSQQQQQQQESTATTSSQGGQSLPSAYTQKINGLYERYFKYTEHNMKSQNIWDANEHQMSEIKYLNGT
jgi:hypothetical protein